MSVAVKRKITSNNGASNSSSKKVYNDVITDKVGNYEKHPFFVKKANEMKEFIAKVGPPKRFASKIK